LPQHAFKTKAEPFRNGPAFCVFRAAMKHDAMEFEIDKNMFQHSGNRAGH